MGNAKILRDAAADAGLEVFGGVNAPYIWVKTPERPNELANVRSDVARDECSHHTGQPVSAHKEKDTFAFRRSTAGKTPKKWRAV